MPDDPVDRLRRSRQIVVPALLVLDEEEAPDAKRAFCAEPIAVPVRIVAAPEKT